ncbi:hypothetical protein AVEN_24957-1 [Araneus ventricosus]|uniref:Uncharacterized protein n=1 Tax=Araneus ventricosus TaxID=182803 RepID=A0A4Y2G816_ARAVE|nr:hypothetical protein AVEN_24957-1 [Araneus ventricosus]
MQLREKSKVTNEESAMKEWKLAGEEKECNRVEARWKLNKFEEEWEAAGEEKERTGWKQGMPKQLSGKEWEAAEKKRSAQVGRKVEN